MLSTVYFYLDRLPKADYFKLELSKNCELYNRFEFKQFTIQSRLKLFLIY